MKNYIYLVYLFIHFCCPGVYAQDTSSRILKADYVDGSSSYKNYIVNPSADQNVVGVTCTSFTQCTRQTSTSDVIQGRASYRFLSLTNGGTAKFDVKSFVGSELQGNNCGASFEYRGGSAYKAYVEVNSVKVTGDYTIVPAGLNQTLTLPEIIYPCGDGSTTTRLVIESTNTTNSDLYVDNVYLGKPRTLSQGAIITAWQDFPSNAAGTLITAVSSNPTYGTVATNFARWRRVGDRAEIEWIFRQTSNGTSGSGLYLFNIPSVIGVIDTSRVPASTSDSDYSTFMASVGSFNYGFSGSSFQATGAVAVYDSTRLKMAAAGATSGGTVGAGTINSGNFGLGSSNLAYTLRASLPIVGWAATGTTVTMLQSNYDPTSFTPTTQGFGTLAASSCFHSRDGVEMIIDCKITAGTVAASTAQLTLPSSNTISSTYVPSIRLAKGYWIRSTASGTTVKRGTVLMNGGDAFITFSNDDYTGTVNPLVSQLGNAIFSNSDVISIYARVPITGWVSNQNAPIFNGGVTSSTNGNLKVEAADINCDAASAITAGTPFFSSVGNRSGAGCALTLASGFNGMSQILSCNVTVKAATVQATACNCTSATSCTIYGPSADYDAYVTIKGLR